MSRSVSAIEDFPEVSSGTPLEEMRNALHREAGKKTPAIALSPFVEE
jgi:hypothetical protein